MNGWMNIYNYPLSSSLQSRSREPESNTDAPAHTGPNTLGQTYMIYRCIPCVCVCVCVYNHHHHHQKAFRNYFPYLPRS